MLKSDGFNLWANAYDKSVNLSEEANEYPFAGYSTPGKYRPLPWRDVQSNHQKS